MLITKGLTAWQRLLNHPAATTPGTTPGAGMGAEPVVAQLTGHPSLPGPAGQPPALLPQAVSAQLVHALAGLAVALTGT